MRRGRFWFHYSVLGLIVLAIALAGLLSFAFHKLHVPLKGFRDGEFKAVTVGSQSISIFNFFIFLLVRKLAAARVAPYPPLLPAQRPQQSHLMWFPNQNLFPP